MTSKSDQAAELFQEGYLCSQAVVSVFTDELELDQALAHKLTTGFGGGIARTGQICGAVSGALIVIGAKAGAISNQDSEAKENTYELVRGFLDKFAAENGSTICNELLDLDMKNPRDLTKAREEGLFAEKCPVFVASAVRIIEELFAKP